MFVMVDDMSVIDGVFKLIHGSDAVRMLYSLCFVNYETKGVCSLYGAEVDRVIFLT